MEEENKKDIYGVIYCAKNTVNGKCYIGKTISTLSRRKTEHYCAAKGGTGGRIVEDLPNKEEIYKKRGLAVKGEKNAAFGKKMSQQQKDKIKESMLKYKASIKESL